jgi:flagellar basal-body rod protein FlgB
MLGRVITQKTTAPALLKSMDAGMLRARTIANNIANVNTPGYRRVEVKFEDQLRRALNKTRLKGAKTDNGHLDLGRKDVSKVNPEAFRPNDSTLPSGVNNVDIDTEMAKLAENQILYNFSTNAFRGVFRKLNAAIQAKPLPQR